MLTYIIGHMLLQGTLPYIKYPSRKFSHGANFRIFCMQASICQNKNLEFARTQTTNLG